ncbi:calcium-binding protein [Okeania sp. SIO2B3]|uniref:calcium-binding protein n=1 Tax=Okeania sp. SIO2B3 TaxID=2607784 RepID=UPI0013C2135C|nr:calcium-binding protein [Okeania sp. SIO2B3]NET40650.1 calcium-binding protein [Okeania sp. SIO2B3]
MSELFLPDFDQAEFQPGAAIDNSYFPLTPGTILAYGAEVEDDEMDDDEMDDDEDDDEDDDDEDDDDEDDDDEDDDDFLESNQVIVTYDTKEIEGVETVVVRDVAWDEGVLVEDTFDWYAQDTEGNVWYMGEIATNYEYDDNGNLIGTNNDGSWEAGVDGALAGFLMEANPEIGDNYYQEFAPDIAIDQAEVVSLNESIEIDLDDYENVLKTLEFTELEPDAFEFKYYAPGVGQILAEEGITEEGGEPELSPELVGISTLAQATLPALPTANFESSAEINNPYFPLKPGSIYIYEGEETDSDTGELEVEQEIFFVTNQTKEILGVTTRVVEEKVFENGLLSEEELAYYAQDTDGNVWLMGEDEIEYEYDEQGQLISTEEDSWQAGQEENLPGYVMVASPQVGDAYYEQFQIGEEEEQAEVVSADASVSTNFGNYNNVVQIREFSELDPDEFEFSYYAPGVGQVLEEEVDEDGEVELSSALVERQNIGAIQLPDIDSVINGTNQGETLVGTDNNDLITALEGNDIVIGEMGDDVIFGNEGNDILRGDQHQSAAGGNDIVYGGAGNDRISGNAGNDLLIGERGEDKIWGNDGNDTLEGRRGFDILLGGSGDDVLNGGQGRDRLNGGPGNDTLIGGASIDRYIFNTNQAFDSNDLGVDAIADFDSERDIILLDVGTFDAIESGASFDNVFATVTDDGAAETADAVIVYNTNNGNLFYNQNGSEPGLGSGGLFVNLEGQPELSADNFVFRL